MVIGFNTQERTGIYNSRLEELENYIGRPGIYTAGNLTVLGVPIEISTKDGYIKLKPSITYVGEFARLEEDFPSTLTIEQGVPMVLRPLREGDLQRIVDESNLKAEFEKERVLRVLDPTREIIKSLGIINP